MGVRNSWDTFVRKSSVLRFVSSSSAILFNIVFLTYKAVVTDPFVLLLVAFPIISAYVIGVKSNKTRYALYEENVENDRTKEYVKRTVYLQDYAKEIRLSGIFDVLMEKFEKNV